MPEFVMPVDFQINTMGGTLDIPAGATVRTNDNGQYDGFTAAETAPEVNITPAAAAHAEELGVDLTQVEPSGGVDGTLITKADVASAAEGG